MCDCTQFSCWFSGVNFFNFNSIFRSMNGTLPRPDLHLPLPNSETDPDSWSCSRSRETSPESSIPPGMPAFRVIPLTCESEAGSVDPFCNGNGLESPYGNGLRGSEPPMNEWETEPLRSGSAQPPTLLRKNQYWVRIGLNTQFPNLIHFPIDFLGVRLIF